MTVLDFLVNGKEKERKFIFDSIVAQTKNIKRKKFQSLGKRNCNDSFYDKDGFVSSYDNESLRKIKKNFNKYKNEFYKKRV